MSSVLSRNPFTMTLVGTSGACENRWQRKTNRGSSRSTALTRTGVSYEAEMRASIRGPAATGDASEAATNKTYCQTSALAGQPSGTRQPAQRHPSSPPLPAVTMAVAVAWLPVFPGQAA